MNKQAISAADQCKYLVSPIALMPTSQWSYEIGTQGSTRSMKWVWAGFPNAGRRPEEEHILFLADEITGEQEVGFGRFNRGLKHAVKRNSATARMNSLPPAIWDI